MIIININVMLAKRRMSLTEFSEKVGFTMANMSLLKNGKIKAFKISTLDKICTVLDCQPGELLEYIPNPPVTQEKKETTRSVSVINKAAEMPI